MKAQSHYCQLNKKEGDSHSKGMVERIFQGSDQLVEIVYVQYHGATWSLLSCISLFTAVMDNLVLSQKIILAMAIPDRKI